jgi:hypothetical protein
VEEEAVRGRSSSLVEVTSSLGLRGGGGARGGSNREVEEPKPRPEPNLLAVVFAGESLKAPAVRKFSEGIPVFRGVVGAL